MNNDLMENGFLDKNSIADLIQSIERNRKLQTDEQMPEDSFAMPLAGKYSDML